ncbi:MAG: hypothetical protein V4692_10880 [Bdellovibrionota bacterium]
MQNTQDERARRIALFFLFSLADERVAFQAAHKAVASLKASSAKASNELGVDHIRLLKKIYDKHKTLLERESLANAVPPTSWQLAPGVSAATWLRFRKNAADQEVIALVLSKIVGFDDESVARGLGVSVGTIRYRVGKALRQLGSMTDKGAQA